MNLSLASAVCVACGNDEEAGPDVAASTNDVRSTCEAQCEYDDRCGGGREDGCLDSCTARLGPASALSREALGIYTECMRDPACLDDDECEDRVAERDPTLASEIDRCIAFFSTCAYEPDISACLRIASVTTRVRERLRGCYEGACESEPQVSACWAAAYE